MIRKIFYSLISILLSFSAYAEQQEYVYEIIADNLSHPWGIAVIDNDNILFTELSGQLRVIEDLSLIHISEPTRPERIS